MFHDQRRWCMTPVGSADDLARMLTTLTWCCCAAFELGDYLFLNDSTSPDGAQEFAVVKRNGSNGRFVQIESITFGWCDASTALRYIREAVAGDYDHNDIAHEVEPRLESPEQHQTCSHCV